MTAWSDWVCESNTGMKQRTRAIATGGVQDAKKCPKKVERAGCDPIPCELNTLEEDVNNPWGACKLKCGVWTKSKALGVKWPAQFGGLCYEETHPVRRVTAPCPAVDCVVTPVDQDTGAWGPCTNSSSSVWTKTKTLSITPALYGGAACSEASLVATAFCLVDCKYTQEPLVCALDGGNFRTKVSGGTSITSQPLHGGAACPVDSCDWQAHCAPLTDADTKAACTAALAKLQPIKVGYFLSYANYVGSMAYWECAERCAAQPGCLGFDHGFSGTSCYLLTNSDTSFSGGGYSSAEAVLMIHPLQK